MSDSKCLFKQYENRCNQLNSKTSFQKLMFNFVFCTTSNKCKCVVICLIDGVCNSFLKSFSLSLTNTCIIAEPVFGVGKYTFKAMLSLEDKTVAY